jgi:SAM-dependent methyltransferase
MNEDASTEAARAQYGRQASQYTASSSHAAGADLGRLTALLALRGDESVLDVATGTGHTALALAPFAKSVTGVDPTPKMLAEAENLAVSRGVTNVRFVIGRAEQLPFEDGSFDVVTVRRAPHHFQSIPRALAEMFRVLRPKGTLAVIDQLTARTAVGIELMERFEKWRDPSHVRALSVAEWRAVLAEAGFEVLHIEIDEERRTLLSYFDIAGTPQVDRDAIVAMLKAADPEALASFGYSPEPGPEGCFLKERIIAIASRPG